MRVLSWMFMCLLSKIWIPSPWIEKFQIKQSTKWSICCGESAFLWSFTSAKRRVLFIWTVEMLVNLVSLKLSATLSIRGNKILECFTRTLHATNIFSSTFIRTYFLKFTLRPRKEDSIWKTTCTSCFKRTKIKWWFVNKIWRRIQEIMKTNTKELAGSNRNQLKTLMNSAILREQDIKQRAEKRNAARHEKTEELWAKKIKAKEEESKAKEGQMWNRLAELNGEFKKIKQSKKDIKKISSTVLQIVVNFLFFSIVWL